MLTEKYFYSHNKWPLLHPSCLILTDLISRSNLVEGIDAPYISKCLYHPEKSPLCPIFKLGDIVKLSGFKFETIASEVSHSFGLSPHRNTPTTQHHTMSTHTDSHLIKAHLLMADSLLVFWSLYFAMIFLSFVLFCFFFLLFLPRDIALCTKLLLFSQGGAIGIVVDWTCNFDLDVRHCKPQYNFHGLYGNPTETDSARTSVGYNFRCVTCFSLRKHCI